VFDVHSSKTGHHQYKNDELGFKKFLKGLPENYLVAIEATSYYHYRLAHFLYENGAVVSFINSLYRKRSIQMKLAKVKTHKSDSKAMCEHALINEALVYSALTDFQSWCLRLFRLLDVYKK
jgi:transposase